MWVICATRCERCKWCVESWERLNFKQMSCCAAPATANCGPIWIPKNGGKERKKAERKENNGGEINHCSLRFPRAVWYKPVCLQRQSKKIMLDSTNSARNKRHQSGAPESACEILRGFSGRYGPRLTDGNGPCVSIANMQMQHKEGCPECNPWWKREQMYWWIIIYACFLKDLPFQLLWSLKSLLLWAPMSDCRRSDVSNQSDQRRFCRFWCERSVMLWSRGLPTPALDWTCLRSVESALEPTEEEETVAGTGNGKQTICWLTEQWDE